MENDQIIAALREFQDSGRNFERVPFAEWHKAGGMALGGGYGPGVGMMGRLGTSSFAPTGPRGKPSGERGVGWGGDRDFPPQYGSREAPTSRPSRYKTERPNQPPPWVDDIDMGNTWYSPFQPIWPFGPPYYTRPRDWDFPVGYNLNFIQARTELMGLLRGMRASWGVLAAIIETRKDQLLRIPWTIQQRDKPRATSRSVDVVRKFFRRPDGKHTYNQWVHKVLDDLFVIDAPSIFMNRTLGGQLRAAEYIDGATIFPLIDDAGRRPTSEVEITANGLEYKQRQPAFQQIIYGLPMVNLSEDELVYAMQRPLPEFPVFGFSPVQQIFTEVTEAIRKTFYQLEFWRSGSIPELIITVPETWTPRQITMFQGHFDALLSGQLSLKSKVRFVPGGMKPFDIKNASGESLWSKRDELLVRLCCYAFSVSPTPFVQQNNRATAQNAQQTAQEEGLYPLMSWWKDDIMDVLIQERMGFEDIEFMFLPRPEVDLVRQAEIHKIKLSTGEMTVDEARAENGEEPYADGMGSVPLVYFGSGAMPLEHIVSGQAALPGAAPSPASRDAAPPRATPQNAMIGGRARGRNASPQPPVKPSPIHKASDRDADRDPTDAQRAVGNYRKRAISAYGLNISIENEKGSKRPVKRSDGTEKKVKMPTAYGYIRGFIGADDDQIDVYVREKGLDKNLPAYVIDQDKFVDNRDHGFDEHKVFLGFKNAAKAVSAYMKSHFDGFGHERLSAVVAMSINDLKDWLRDGDLKRPIAESGYGTVIARRGVNSGIVKADTISTGTNLSWYDQTVAVARRRRKKRKKALRATLGPRWRKLNA